jgi:hypothetical protein
MPAVLLSVLELWFACTLTLNFLLAMKRSGLLWLFAPQVQDELAGTCGCGVTSVFVCVFMQVLGDSFFDPAEERVPMSPALALETARVRAAAAAATAYQLSCFSLVAEMGQMHM